MYYNKVEICGVNTSKLKTLTDEQKRDLLQRTKAGDMDARQELIYGNLRLVLSIIQRFTNRHESMDDLFQVGCVGLIKAVDNFNTDLDVKFSTYAVPMITGEIKRYLRDNNPLRISRSIKDIAYKTLKLKEQLMDINGNYPTNAEIADILGVSEYDIISALESLKDPISMYEPIYNDGGDTIYLFDQIAAKTDDYELDTKISLDKALNSLKKRERYILDQRYIIGKTQMEIALELGISQAQISRIEKNAITHIKKKVK